VEPGIASEKHAAITKFILRSTLPIYLATKERQFPIGTGTLFTINGAFYVITAAHVAAQCRTAPLALPTTQRALAVTGLGHHEVLHAAKSEQDIGLIALHDDLVIARLRRAWTFLGPENIAVPRSDGPFLVQGYLEPSRVRPGLTPPGQLLGIISTRWRGEVPPLADPFDPQNDLMLELGAQALDGQTLEMTPTPHVHGMSGASVWEVRPEHRGELWTPQSQVRIVGIQSSELHGSYLRAKRWHLLWSAFKECDVDAAQELRAALEADIPGRRKRPASGKKRKSGH
jgi:hypothetical protein